MFGWFYLSWCHADGEADLFRVAKKEVEEETGLVVEQLINSDIIARNLDMEKIRLLETENSAVKLVSLEDGFTSEDNVDCTRPINEKIVTRVRNLKNERIIN